MKKQYATQPVDLASLRGLSSHAESHWLTFATAMKCYSTKSKRSKLSLQRAAEKHGPSWLRSALHAQGQPATIAVQNRPKELEPETGSLAFLTAGAEEALHSNGAAAPPPRKEQSPPEANSADLMPTERNSPLNTGDMLHPNVNR